MTTVASVNALDVDSIVMPIEPEQLELMPSYLICELDNSPQLIKDVSGACCLARMGFRLYAYLTDQMKLDLCDYFCCQGLAVLPHTGTYCLVQGKIPCGLRMLGRGLRHCSIAIVIIVKLPTVWRLHLLTCVSSQSSHHCVLYGQDLISVDIARYFIYISIFGKEDDVSDNIYQMLGQLGGVNGSVELNLELPHTQTCELKWSPGTLE